MANALCAGTPCASKRGQNGRVAAIPLPRCTASAIAATSVSRPDRVVSGSMGKNGMPNNLSAVLSSEEIATLVHEAVAEAEANRGEIALQKLEPLRDAQRRQREAAMALLWVVNQFCLPREVAAEILAEIARSHDRDVDILPRLGSCLEAARDIDELNAPPPDHPLFVSLFERLREMAADHQGKPDHESILDGLAIAARMLARQQDETAQRSYRALTEIDPRNPRYHYGLGLFYKTRGRFADGMRANQIAMSLLDEPAENYQWNLGICATGAGNAVVALDVWKQLGLDIAIGRFGLPECALGQCKVKLAERPLAERSAENDDPGDEETIWIERLSPCHGIVRSVLYQALGVDYGDVVLFDGAPITYHTYGDMRIPVFPHLATLIRRNYQVFDFAGTQETEGQLADMSQELDGDAVIYSHSESIVMLCADCWRDPDRDHDNHEGMEKHVVRGKIAAPAEMDPKSLLDRIDAVIETQERRCLLYAPDLCKAAGLTEREAIERRRFDLLMRN
ncbi:MULTISPECIES: prenyltransferase [unclassified Bradyrhizobium]|uniref:prenyltransferase n=1 Tax=unclassified Bradyrhizobium TaxID=2631580 RepID=UPI0028E4838B|nr:MULTISPECIES: prenyltransferase [unclassified Bradyrhizobium]